MVPRLRRLAAASLLSLLPALVALAAAAEDAPAPPAATEPSPPPSAAPPAAGKTKPTVVGEGAQVSIEYTLKLDDGSTADTNVGQEPLVYQQGQGQMLPALEKALVGLAVDDTKHVKLSPEDGYGPVDPEAFQTVPAAQVPEEARTPGALMIAEDGSGRRQQVRVHEVKGDEVVVDMNHPLAGKTLHFDVKILAIQ